MFIGLVPLDSNNCFEYVGRIYNENGGIIS